MLHLYVYAEEKQYIHADEEAVTSNLPLEYKKLITEENMNVSVLEDAIAKSWDVYIDESRIEGAGLGLFAAKTFAKGFFVSCFNTTR